MERDRIISLSLCPAQERRTHIHIQIFSRLRLKKLGGVKGTEQTQDKQRGLWESEVARWGTWDQLQGQRVWKRWFRMALSAPTSSPYSSLLSKQRNAGSHNDQEKWENKERLIIHMARHGPRWSIAS